MLFKVDPDPDPGKEIEVDPDPDPRRGSKWIRIRIRPNVVDPGGSGSGSETLLCPQVQDPLLVFGSDPDPDTLEKITDPKV